MAACRSCLIRATLFLLLISALCSSLPFARAVSALVSQSRFLWSGAHGDFRACYRSVSRSACARIVCGTNVLIFSL